RGLARLHEMQIRRTLGAPTRVLAGQLLFESAMIGLAGAALGVLLAHVGLGAFMALAPEALPRADTIRIDLRVLGFAAAAGSLTALVFGMVPAIRLVGGDIDGALRGRGRGMSDSRTDARLRSALVVAEVALSVVLVVHAASLLRTFARLNAEQLGFRTEGVWTLPLKPNDVETAGDWSRRMDAVREALNAVPGVSMATFGMTMPLEYTGGSSCCWRTEPRFADATALQVATDMHIVDADYFGLLELEFVAGRPWSRQDARSQPGPVVVSERLAIQVHGSAAAAIGRQLSVDDREFGIVGVVANTRHYGPDQDHRPAAYIPAPLIPWASHNAHLAVRADGAPAGLAGRLREAVWSVEPELPVPVIRPLAEWAAAATAQARFTAALFATFGAVALLLMAGGLYGTLLYAVGRKRRELGIRLALGDAPSRLERRVIGRGLATATMGCVFGAAGAWGATKVLASQVSGLELGHPATFAAGIGVLLVAAIAASWLPARRAARTNPLEALRAE
ncbi:MAG: FtsX-like permease family protein, partial [Longimicrobiales bacterium]